MESSRPADGSDSWSARILPKEVCLCIKITEHWLLSLEHLYPVQRTFEAHLKFILLENESTEVVPGMLKIAMGLIRQTYYTASGFSESLFKTAKVPSNHSVLYINSRSSKKSELQSKKINMLLVKLPVCACNEQLSKTTKKKKRKTTCTQLFLVPHI